MPFRCFGPSTTRVFVDHLLVPGQPQQGHRVRRLVHDGGVLLVPAHQATTPPPTHATMRQRQRVAGRASKQLPCPAPGSGVEAPHAPEVKDAHAAVCRDGAKHRGAAPANVVHLLVMRNELRVHHAPLRARGHGPRQTALPCHEVTCPIWPHEARRPCAPASKSARPPAWPTPVFRGARQVATQAAAPPARLPPSPTFPLPGARLAPPRTRTSRSQMVHVVSMLDTPNRRVSTSLQSNDVSGAVNLLLLPCTHRPHAKRATPVSSLRLPWRTGQGAQPTAPWRGVAWVPQLPPLTHVREQPLELHAVRVHPPQAQVLPRGGLCTRVGQGQDRARPHQVSGGQQRLPSRVLILWFLCSMSCGPAARAGALHWGAILSPGPHQEVGFGGVPVRQEHELCGRVVVAEGHVGQRRQHAALLVHCNRPGARAGQVGGGPAGHTHQPRRPPHRGWEQRRTLYELHMVLRLLPEARHGQAQRLVLPDLSRQAASQEAFPVASRPQLRAARDPQAALRALPARAAARFHGRAQSSGGRCRTHAPVARVDQRLARIGVSGALSALGAHPCVDCEVRFSAQAGRKQAASGAGHALQVLMLSRRWYGPAIGAPGSWGRSASAWTGLAHGL